MSLFYVKARPDRAVIISGLRKNPKVLIGKAGFKIPFFDRQDQIILKQISIDIKTNGAIPTKDFIGVDVDAIAKIRLRIDAEGIQLAMKNFLNMGERQIIETLTDSLQGNMREIIGTITLKEISNDRKRFGDEVQEKAQPDMKALGVEIISCNIQRVDDEDDLINSLGQENMSQIQKDASIAKAEADKEVVIATAEAKKASNEAQVISEMEIAQKQNDLYIKKAQLQKESAIQKAIADAAYEIQNQEQRKTIEVAKADADIAKQEKAILVKEKESKVKEQTLDAEIKKKADADRYARQQEAEAQKYEQQAEAEASLFTNNKTAEARLYTFQKEAEALKSKAEADKYVKQQEAEGIQAVGMAEAEAIKAKGIAEAEAIEKKAEAMAKMGQASVLDMYFKVLPDVVKNIAEPMSKIDKITMYGDGNNTKLMKDITGTLNQVTDGLKESTGVDLQNLISGFIGGKIGADDDK